MSQESHLKKTATLMTASVLQYVAATIHSDTDWPSNCAYA